MFFSIDRKVNYYETDQMSVVHHSNYIRWFEEARCAHLNSYGLYYSKMEDHGIICPVIAVNVKFRSPARYDDTVTIKIRTIQYTSIRMTYEYQVYRDDTLLVTATSEHTITDRDFNLLRLKNHKPEIFEIFQKMLKDGLKEEVQG